MSTASNENITLPISFLVEILTNSQPSHLFGIRARSRVDPTIPDFSPSIVRYEVGVILKAKDPEENLVKIFLYKDTFHAEVWLRSEWEQSISKRMDLVRISAANIAAESAANEKFEAVSAFVESTMGLRKSILRPQHMKMVAILQAITTLPIELEVFPGIRDVLTKYGNLQS